MPAARAVLVVALAPAPAVLDHLRDEGWQPVTVPGLAEAAELLRSRSFAVAILFEGGDPQAASAFEECLLAAGSCEWIGVFAAGATSAPPWRDHVLAHFFDHHVAPVAPSSLAQTVAHAWTRASLRAQQAVERASASDMGMVGRSPPLERLRRAILRAGPAEAPVLISGESGTGKELVARALHASSSRSNAPFVAVNCGALPPTLVHSELFGHERGSFSGAVAARRGLIEGARGGTLFLDEIAELPLDSQATLLRFLQEGRILRVGSATEIVVDTRVIAASHVDLQAAVAAGTFRADLFFRLDVLALQVPPLRERRQDIPLLAGHAHARAVVGNDRAPRGFHSEAVAAMLAHDWPGNVRELMNRVQRAVLMSESPLIRAADLGLAPAGLAISGVASLQLARMQAERIAIRHSLERSGQNLAQAARQLGVSRMTLYRLLAKHSITLPSP